jgi:hypothetical protein
MPPLGETILTTMNSAAEKLRSIHRILEDFFGVEFSLTIDIATVGILLAPVLLLAHTVGEPELEKELIWKQCCSDHDCVPQQVHILGAELNGKLPIEIDHLPTSVSKEKFFPVRSTRTWVCYRGGHKEASDNNIRCILYPQKGDTVETPGKDRPKG